MLEVLKSSDDYVNTNRDVFGRALETIRDHLGDLMVTGQPSGAEITLAGKPVGRLPLARPLRVPIGTIEIQVSAQGYWPVQRELRIEKRSETVDSVELAPRQIEPPSPAVPAGSPRSLPTPARAELQGRRPGSWQWPVAWVASAGALVGLGAGTAFHLEREARAKEFNQAGNGCGENFPMQGAPGCKDKHDQVSTATNLAITGYSVAAVLGGVATVLFVTAPAREPANPSATLTCIPVAPATTEWVLLCKGRF